MFSLFNKTPKTKIIKATELQPGMFVRAEGVFSEVVSCQPVRPGKGIPIVQTRLRSESGIIFERTFRMNEELEVK